MLFFFVYICTADYQLDPSTSIVEWRISPDTWSPTHHPEHFPENMKRLPSPRARRDVDNPLNISITYDLSAAASSLHTSITEKTQSAIDIWNDLLPARRSTHFAGRSLDIDFQIRTFDSSSTLGMAGPTHYTVTPDGFAYVTRGLVYISELYVESLLLSNNYKSVATHELAHVLGFPSMWQFHSEITTNGAVFSAGTTFAGAVDHEFPANGFSHTGM